LSTTLASPVVTTVYQVLITDPSGCTFTDSVKIIVRDVYCREPYIYVPNAFTPNSDNTNDKVFVRGEYIESMVFSIYNRWGESVFETSDLNSGWDGHYRSQACEPGVYVYYLEATCYNREVFKSKGNITLIR
jgi:gliding motility-associated-like protein